jgi:hypothetical protein
MFTPEGWEWMAKLVADQVGNGGWIVIAGGGKSSAAPVKQVEVTDQGDGAYRLTAVAVFAEGDANFEWEKRLVKLPDGTVIDALEADLGRKAEGAEWEIAVKIDFGKDA